METCEVVGIPSGEIKVLSYDQMMFLVDSGLIHYNHIHNYWYLIEDELKDKRF